MFEYGDADDMFYDGGRAAVCTYINTNDGRALCCVSKRAIEDYYRTTLDDNSCLDRAKNIFDELASLWGRRISLGAYEKDGSILTRSSDLNG